MDENYIKVLNSFDFKDYFSSEEIKECLKKSDHIDTTKIIKKYELTKPYDYVRACGENSFTDFALNKLNKITQEDSKYIIIRNIKGKLIYLYTNKLTEKLEEMNWLAAKGYFSSITSTNNKIKGYFRNDDNVITIGKKSVGEIKITLEEANINTLASRKHYLFDKKHLAIQGQIAALGNYFGYMTKLARNDKNKKIYDIDLNTVSIATMKNLDLSNIKSRQSFKAIDFVDVIWIDKVKNNLTVAFEVELNKDWPAAIDRLMSVSYANSNSEDVTNIIISDREDDYINIKEYAKMDFRISVPIKFRLAHLTTSNLIEVLEMRDKGISLEHIREGFFKKLKYIK